MSVLFETPDAGLLELYRRKRAATRCRAPFHRVVRSGCPRENGEIRPHKRHVDRPQIGARRLHTLIIEADQGFDCGFHGTAPHLFF